MPDLVEYCIDNVTPAVRENLPSVCEPRPCLWRCGLCYAGAIMAVDGELRAGPSHEAILDELDLSLDR
jgi:uncharacterized protein YuzB (UPF0349 family)